MNYWPSISERAAQSASGVFGLLRSEENGALIVDSFLKMDEIAAAICAALKKEIGACRVWFDKAHDGAFFIRVGPEIYEHERGGIL